MTTTTTTTTQGDTMTTTMTTQRMRIETEPSGHVVISYPDPWEEDKTRRRRFSAPSGGGYVQEHDGHGGTRQVCDALASTGDTLMASRASLSTVIRAEYRRMRRQVGGAV